VVEARRERKVVTVLFADLVGFTLRAEQLDPEDVAAELGRYHAHVREDLERHGGTVETFIGDAAMAIFGAPVAHEDDPERAVRAALAIEHFFRHLLAGDVAYGQIPRAERAEKHLAAVGWIEHLGRREDHAEMLAYHYLQALERTAAAGRSADAFSDAARDSLTDAGDRALAPPRLRRRRAVLPGCRRASARERPRGRLLLRLGRALFYLGEPDVSVIERAAAAFLDAGDVEGVVEAETTLSEHAWMAGERDLARATLDRGETLATGLPVSAAKARATNAHFELCRAMGNLAAGGRGGEAASALACWPGVPWAVAGAAYARGDYVAAAEQCAALGTVTQEAYVRLAAARAGDLVQLEPALEFYRSVGAAWYLRQGESILAASA
jgi:hypothetical protein